MWSWKHNECVNSLIGSCSFVLKTILYVIAEKSFDNFCCHIAKFCHYLCFVTFSLLKIAERTILPSVRANNEFDYHQLSSLSQYKIWVWNQVFGNFPILNAALLLFHDGFYPIDTIFVGKIANNIRHLFKISLFLHDIRHFPVVTPGATDRFGISTCFLVPYCLVWSKSSGEKEMGRRTTFQQIFFSENI